MVDQSSSALEDLVKEFLQATPDIAGNCHIDSFREAFTKWKNENSTAVDIKTLPSHPTITKRKLDPMSEILSKKSEIQQDLINLFDEIVKDVSINLPTQYTTDGEKIVPLPDSDSILSSSLHWSPFLFQFAKGNKLNLLFSTPSIVRQAVVFQTEQAKTNPSAQSPSETVKSESVPKSRKDKSKKANTVPLASVWARVILDKTNEIFQEKKRNYPTLKSLDLTFSLSDERVGGHNGITGFIDVSLNQTQDTSSSMSEGAMLKRTRAESQFSETSDPNGEAESSRHCLNPQDFTQLNEFKFGSLGYIDSCFKFKYGTPRQGSVVPSSRARLVLHSNISADSIIGLSEYSHVWLLFVFHSNTHKKYHPKIAPPRLNGQRVGCLATRTPHRWNDIGLSLVRLERVEVPMGFAGIDIEKNNATPGRVPIVQRSTDHFLVTNPGMVKAGAVPLPGCAALVFSGVDLVDGTPIVDVKPYHPSDCVMPDNLQIPTWQRELPLAALQVVWSKRSKSDLNSIFVEHHEKIQKSNAKSKKTSLVVSSGSSADSSPLQFYQTQEEIMQAVTETLSMDPRPLCTKTRHEEGIYGFVFDKLNVIYRMLDPKTAEVCFVEQYVAEDSKDMNDRSNRKREIMNQKDWLEQIKAKLALAEEEDMKE